jgi:hypothetical protein
MRPVLEPRHTFPWRPPRCEAFYPSLVRLVAFLVTLSVFVTGCHTCSRESGDTSTPAPVAVAAADADDAVTRASPCAALGPLPGFDAGAFVSGGTVLTTPEIVIPSRCSPSKAGAWAMVVTRVARRETCESGLECSVAHVEWDAVHVTAAGAVARLHQAYDWAFFERTRFGAWALSDLDGDGEDELIVPWSEETRQEPDGEGMVTEKGSIFRFAAGRVEPYPSAAGVTFFEAKDVDHDGRMDLLTHAPFIGKMTRTCTPIDVRVTGPTLVRHTRAHGVFSAHDDAARHFALEACPSARPTLLLGPDGKSDPEHLYLRFACARLWGVKEKDLRSRLHTECAAVRAAYEREDAMPVCDREFEGNLCDEHADLPWPEAPFTLVAPERPDTGSP